MHVTEADDRDRPGTGDVDIIDLEFIATDLSMAGLLRLDLRRSAGATRFLASILRPGDPPVTVLDYDLPLATGAFEFRAPGVWVELCCEAPLDHWTVGLEAFGLALPATEIVTPDSYGDRVPLGLDLDVETTGSPQGDADAFLIDVAVRGEVLVGVDAYEIEATGLRSRTTTGSRPPFFPWGSEPPALGELSVAWPMEDGRPEIERRTWHGGSLPRWATRYVSGE